MRRTSTMTILFLLATPPLAAQSLPLDVNDPQQGAVLRDATPAFSGISAPDVMVTVTVGESVTQTTANGTGNWATRTSELEDGEHVATVAAAMGAETSVDVVVSFTIDTQPPALVLVEPTANALVDATTTVQGNSDPDTTIEAYIDDVFVGSTAGGAAWSLAIPAEGELAPGPHDLMVIARDRAGNESILAIPIEVRPLPDFTDTDGDGLIDRIERALGTNVDDVDTDGDGLTDYDEFDDLGTDPRSADTDGDGVTDADEIAQRTDPRRPELSVAPPASSSPGGQGCVAAGASPGSGWLVLAALLFKRARRR